MKTHPYEHQLESLRQSQGRRSFGLLMEMGAGKSKTAIDEMCDLWSAGLVDRVLIVSGKGSYANWTNNELPTHMWDSVEWTDHLWQNTGNMRERDDLAYLVSDLGRRVMRILVVNIEALGASQRAQKIVSDFVRGGRTIIVMDESTLIKNHEAIRTKFMIRMGDIAEYRRILTGSPVTRDPLDLWGQFRFLGDGLLGFRSFFAFRARYCVMQAVQVGTRSVQKPVAFVNLEELAERVAQYSYRVTKEQCLDLPPKVYQFRNVEMTDEQRRLYESMRRMALALLQHEDGSESLATSKTAMSTLLKLHQMLCGYVRDDEGIVHRIANNRISALKETVEEFGTPSTIVWCAYRLDVDAVCEALCQVHGRERVVSYDGRTDTAGRAEAVRRFQSGEATFFVSTPHTGGRGITLTRGTLVVYYSNTHDLELRLQSEDRPHRIGQEHPVNYVDLRVLRTVDDKMVAALRAKIDIATIITGDKLKEWLI